VEALEHEADACAAHRGLLVWRECGDVAAFEPVMAGVGAVEQTEQVEQRRFAGTRRSHDRDVLAGLDAQRDVAQGVHLAVAELEDAVDVLEFDLGHGVLLQLQFRPVWPASPPR
jgi:hypothetical protein